MNINKSLLAVLSIFLILLLFVSSASAADANTTDVLSVDESANMVNNEMDVLSIDESVNFENNETNILSADNNVNNDEILGNDLEPDDLDIKFPKNIYPNKRFSITISAASYLKTKPTGDFNLTLEGVTYTGDIKNAKFDITNGIKKTTNATIYWPGDDNYNPFSTSFEIPVQGGGRKDVNPTFSQYPNPAKPGAMIGITVSNFGDYSVPPTGTAYLTIGKNTYKSDVKNSFPINAQAPEKTSEATLTWDGDDNYNPYKKTFNIIVESTIPTNITVNPTSLDLTVGESGYINASLNPSEAGELTVDYDTKILKVEQAADTGEWIVAALAEGNATITFSFAGSEGYAAAENKTVTVIVNDKPSPRKDLNISATAEPITVGDNATVVVTGLENATGDVSVIVNGKTYTAPIKRGEATVTVPGLTETVTADVNYAGDENYNNASTTVEIVVNPAPEPSKKNLTISASAEPITVGEDANVIVTGLENATGKVTVIINNKEYTAPIKDGEATVTVPGLTETVTAAVNYAGDENYNSASTTVNITVIPESEVIIVADDVVKYYGGPERFIANIYDSAMNPIANKSVSIKINGVTYNRTTDDNGTVSLAIRLGSGTYNVTTTVDNITKESMVSVLSTIDGADITKYYKNDTQYSVLVCDATGKAVGAGEVVTFNVNGRLYNRTTDENGIATLNINLPPGEYVITATNPVTGEMQSNNITVLPVLSANDLTMKYLDGSQFKANLVDGQGKPYKDQTVTFNVNGILYNKVTDSNGQAALNIRLPPGEYIITSSFNGVNVANKITITG